MTRSLRGGRTDIQNRAFQYIPCTCTIYKTNQTNLYIISSPRYQILTRNHDLVVELSRTRCIWDHRMVGCLVLGCIRGWDDGSSGRCVRDRLISTCATWIPNHIPQYSIIFPDSRRSLGHESQIWMMWITYMSPRSRHDESQIWITYDPQADLEKISEPLSKHSGGCGFIGPELLQRLTAQLSHLPRQRRQQTTSVQVRIFGPRVGVLKGLLTLTHGIQSIQYPAPGMT